MNTQTQKTQTENSNMNFGDQMKMANMLCEAMNAEQLRRFAHHHDVPRSRGDRKMQTALKVVKQNPAAAESVDLEGDFVVYCGHCGTRGGQRFQTETAEKAVDEARTHKSRNPSHFPIALDIRSEQAEKIYG